MDSAANSPTINIPDSLKPRDGRFGCGPAKIRPAAISKIDSNFAFVIGTSHRQPPVKKIIDSIRTGLSSLFSLPQGYEVVLGNGGATAFWDIATFCLIERKSQHLSFGEFSAKFASAVRSAPFLDRPTIIESKLGTHPLPIPEPGIDVYALTHNETSTGVTAPILRPNETTGSLVLVDGTSGAGGAQVSASEFDTYYFAPQKSFASEGGIWIALMSPAALVRVTQIKASNRWIPAFLDLSLAIENSRLNQTYNTPAIITLALLADQIEWMNVNGGLTFAAGRSRESARIIYEWAERTSYTEPFVTNPDMRSNVVATINFNSDIDAQEVAKILRANGIVDIEPYRKLGMNQLRIGMFPAIDPFDIAALTVCIDYVVSKLSN